MLSSSPLSKGTGVLKIIVIFVESPTTYESVNSLIFVIYLPSTIVTLKSESTRSTLNPFESIV